MNKKNYEPVVFNLKYFEDDIVTASNAMSVKQDAFFEGESMGDIFE
jgi:hypothetical protein